MNTNKVYFMQAYFSTKVTKHYSDEVVNIMDISIDYKTEYQKATRVLVLCKRNIFGKLIVKDLNRNVKYEVGIPLSECKTFVMPETAEEFNAVTGNKKKILSKRKIIGIGSNKLN